MMIPSAISVESHERGAARITRSDDVFPRHHHQALGQRPEGRAAVVCMPVPVACASITSPLSPHIALIEGDERGDEQGIKTG